MSKKHKFTGTSEGLGSSAATMNRAIEGGDGAMRQSSQIEDAEIAQRAYQIYEREGRSDGKDLEHWLQAEAELKSERQGHSQGAQPGSQASQPTAPRSARLQQEQEGAGRPTAAQSGLQSGMSGAR
jgi:hypothetical protein